jgi:hypothetical protein
VEYIEPRIPSPDTATLADARASQRRYQASISSISRHISIEDDPYSDSFWIAVGDSAEVSVHESKCTYDSCLGGMLSVGDSLWTLDDSVFAVLRPIVRSANIISFSGTTQVVGRRPGHTTLRVALPPMSSDTAPSRTPPARVLKREVVVTPPLKRIELFPRVDSLRVDESVELRVRVGDVDGRWYENPPSRVTVGRGDRSYIMQGASPVRVQFDKPGPQMIVARFGRLVDTLTIRVVPAR